MDAGGRRRIPVGVPRLTVPDGSARRPHRNSPLSERRGALTDTTAKATGYLAATLLIGLAGCAQRPYRTLAEGLQSENPADRISATIQAADTGDHDVLPLLVDQLDDPDADVRLYAILSLRKLTGQTLGYRFYAEPAERAEAVARWRAWLADRPKR